MPFTLQRSYYYKQLIDSQRYQIESYLKAGFSQTQIAFELEVHKSTICRELKRNSKKRISKC